MFTFTFAFLSILCMLIFHRKDSDKIGNCVLDYQTCEYTKALLMLMVILHHLALGVYYDVGKIEDIVISFSRHSGVYICSLFFFFSGYGLVYSMKNKPGYLDGFARRLMKIIVPYGIANIVFFALLSWQRASHQECSGIMALWSDIIHEISFMYGAGATLVKYAWFIDELILFYLVFYICNRYFSKALAIVLQFLFQIAFVYFCVKLQWGEWRYGSILGFIFGQLFCYSCLSCGVKRYYCLFVAVCAAVGCGTLCYLSPSACMTRYLMAPLCVLPIVFLLTLLHAKQTACLHRFASVSFEAYMYQGLAFTLCAAFVHRVAPYCPAVISQMLYFGGSLLLSVLLGNCFHVVNGFVLCRIGVTTGKR